MSESTDPMEIGAFPLPNWDFDQERENAFLKHVFMILTNQFFNKTFDYIQPVAGFSTKRMSEKLVYDILITVVIAMERSRPEPDVPQDQAFIKCVTRATERLATLLNDMSDEDKKQMATSYAKMQVNSELFDALISDPELLEEVVKKMRETDG